jgi:uncharacterized protein (DUF697 family)/tellurite resistance protein
MQEQDREPIGTICLLAALVDGFRSPEEHAHLQRIAARLGAAPALDGTVSLRALAAGLSSQTVRRQAYEMAVAVVYSDGHANEREQQFLAELRGALELAETGALTLDQEASTLAEAPLALGTPERVATERTPKGLFASQGGIPTISPDTDLDNLIRKQAMLTGALEILPQQIATLAVIPLQMRLIYRIGADYGHQLDAAQIRDLLGAMGIGAAAQVLDGMARRVLGGLGRGLFGSTLGGIVGGTAAVAAGAGLAFITTYAMGHAAKQYYAQGRRLSREDLAALFHRFRAEAEALLPKVQEQIHQQSQHVDLPKLLDSIRGTSAR